MEVMKFGKTEELEPWNQYLRMALFRNKTAAEILRVFATFEAWKQPTKTSYGTG